MYRLNRRVEKLVLNVVPASRRNALRHQTAKSRFNQYMKSKLGHFFRNVDTGPVGDEEIIMRTAVLAKGDVARKVDPEHYFASGYTEVLAWLQRAEEHGFNLRTARAIMELGCGSARLIRHLRCLDGVRLVGSDVKPEFMDWCSKNIPGVEFFANELEPPLKFAADNTFDLVYAQSVFTHIPLATQQDWIKEMHRIIRPGGFALFSILGPYHQQQMLSKAELEVLNRDGHYELDSNAKNASVSTQVIGSWDVFQTRKENMDVFGKYFEVCDYVPAKLDLLVLRKPV